MKTKASSQEAVTDMLPCPDCGCEAVKCGDWGLWGVRCSNYYKCNNVGTMHPRQEVAVKLWNEKRGSDED